MKLIERKGRKQLSADEVLIKHPWPTRTWFIDSRQRSRRALKMTPKAVMELCDWFEQNGKLFCVSKKSGKTLVWLSWQPALGEV